jgi:hypothetical protein
MMDTHEKAIVAALSMLGALIVYLSTCQTAEAAPHTIRFRNPDATRTYTELRTQWGTVPVSCAPGATCSVVIDIPFGRRTVVGQAAVGGVWSGDSNALTVLVQPTPVECLAIPACRFDADRDGVVAGSDFVPFTQAFGTTWIPAP